MVVCCVFCVVCGVLFALVVCGCGVLFVARCCCLLFVECGRSLCVVVCCCVLLLVVRSLVFVVVGCGMFVLGCCLLFCVVCVLGG